MAERSDPLAYLGAEIEELQGPVALPAAAHHVRPTGAPHDDRRAPGHQPLVEQLPRPGHPSPPRRGSARRQCATWASAPARCAPSPATMELHRGAGAAPGRLQARRGGAHLPVGPHRQQRDVIPAITTDRDLIVSDELNHASIIDGVRLSKASRAVFPHRDVDGLEKVLREARASGGPNGAYRAHPGHHRRRLLDGRRHRAAAGHLRRCRPLRGRGHGRRRPCLGRARPQRARHGRPLRPPRSRRHPGRHALQGGRRDGRLRRRPAAPARTTSPSAAGRSSSRRRSPPAVAAACIAAIDVLEARTGAHRAALGRTRASSRPAWPPWASTPASRRRRSRRSWPATSENAGRLSQRLFELGRLRHSGRLPDGRPGQGTRPHDRDQRALVATTCRPASTRSPARAGSCGSSDASHRWVCLDVGETLIDETRVWSTWADVLGVPRLTFMAALGAAIARGRRLRPRLRHRWAAGLAPASRARRASLRRLSR